MTSLREVLVQEAKRIEEDTNHSARSHFVEALRWRRVRLSIGIPTVIAGAISGLTALAQFDYHGVIASILALLAAAAAAVMTFLNPHEQENAHLNAGNRYLALRNDAGTFLRIDSRSEHSDEELVAMLKHLARRRNRLNQSSPSIPRRAFLLARKGIEAGETKYQVDSPTTSAPSKE